MIKRLLKKSPIVIGFVIATMVTTAGTSFGAAQTTSQSIVGGGSDTTYYMMTAIGDLYNQAPGCNPLVASGTQPLDGSCPNSGSENKADSVNYFHDFTAERFPIGSGGGINQLCQHGLAGVASVAFARSSRVPLGSAAGGSDCAGLKFIGYARDAITWECFPGGTNPCGNGTLGTNNSLTVAQLKNVFVNCSVTDWSGIGGTAGAIDVYVPQKNSGTGVSWAAFLGVTLASGDTLNNCIPLANRVTPGTPPSHISFENVNTLIHANGDEANAIFPWSVGVYHFTYGPNNFTGSDGSSLGKINGIQATDANILNGTFPATRFLFNVYCQGTGSPAKCGSSTTAQAWTKAFVGPTGFICKNESKFNDSSSNPIVDPVTHQKYRGAPSGSTPTGEIPDAINNAGFVPLAKQAPGGTTGTYCITQSS